MHTPRFVYPSTSQRPVGLFPVLTAVNDAAVNTHMQALVWTCFCPSWLDSQVWILGQDQDLCSGLWL